MLKMAPTSAGNGKPDDLKRCPLGHPMERREGVETHDAYGHRRVSGASVYYVCPICGHDSRSP
jgi:hypothetical protein